ncbi:aminotransferase class V-fold PLP-dependent enzyme [Roseivirga sp. BDSF3-8]|uniref:aminotransferase class V-fold PLP-dependent enzyme n=1 Tax=Roseivirga sp. BDSF3-8 TaxID=3241598 RepID=UPI0035326AA1
MTQSSQSPLPSQKSLFDIADDITYLNMSAMSPNLNSVAEAGHDEIDRKRHPWLYTQDDWFTGVEALRDQAASLFETPADNLALIPSVSYGLAVAAKNIPLKAVQNIVVLDGQFPSNVYVWRELTKAIGLKIVTVRAEEGENWTEALLRHIDAFTGLVSVPFCHWTDGALIDLEAIGEKARKVGAALVVDASQSLGAHPIPLDRIKPDFMVAVGYKWLLGPYGLGYMYADPKYHEEGQPIEYNWLMRKGSDDFTKLTDYQDDYKQGARRFDFGENSSFIHVAMARKALEQIQQWGIPNIQGTLRHLTDEVVEWAEKNGFHVPSRRVGHMIGVQLPEEVMARAKATLQDQAIYVSYRKDKIRVSPYLYSSQEDIRKLTEALDSIL